jgi:hypothetical protein
MEEEQQQRALPTSRRYTPHEAVLQAIERLENPLLREDRYQLLVDRGDHNHNGPSIDRQSLEYMVHFLDENSDSHQVVITELVLHHVALCFVPDGGLDVLQGFFSRSDTALTKVTLFNCSFGGNPEFASLLLAAFRSNGSVTDLTIRCNRHLRGGTALGAGLSGLLQNMPQLQRLDCAFSYFSPDNDGVMALQPGLRSNRTLKELVLHYCGIQNAGLRLVVDALVGNAIIDVLDVSWNDITYRGLADVTRLIESTQLKTLSLCGNSRVFQSNQNATHCFVTALQHAKSSLQELPWISEYDFSNDEAEEENGCTAAATFASINNSLTRNRQLNHVNNLLLARPRPPPPLQQPNAAATMMLKVSNKAIAKFATVTNNAGASAIFQLFTSRPQLLEKRLQRPAPVAAVAAAAVSQATEPKRRRL